MKKTLVFLYGCILTFKYLPLRIVEISGQLLPENSIGCKIRGYFYKPFLKKCGYNFQVGLRTKLEHLHNIEIGNNVYIGYNNWISGVRGGIILEDEVMFGPNVNMVSSNHTFQNGSARFSPGIGKPIKIGRGTWIASGVTIVSGTIVGKGCLLAAGAVVRGELKDNGIYGGVPAKYLGDVKEN